jgi:tetratricopeptide (TPR) repeat protein
MVRVLMDAFVKYSPPEPDRMEHWPIWRGLVVHAETLYARGEDAGLQTPNTKLLRNLCTLHSEQGRFAAGLIWGRKALIQDETELGPTHLETLSSAYSVAVALALQGNAEAAEPLFRRVFSERQQQLGSEALDTSRALQWLGNVMSWQGKKEAAPLQERALAVFERGNPESHDTLWSLWSLGGSRSADPHAAEPLLRRAVAIENRLHGSDYVPILAYSVSLSDCLSRQGKHAEAEALARKAAEGLERIVGPDYRWTWYAIHNVAECLTRRGDFSSAEPIARRALELGRYAENPQSLWTFTRTLARILEQQGKIHEAEPLYRGLIESIAGELGADSRQARRAREDWDRCRTTNR